jgi:hypothetical protein
VRREELHSEDEGVLLLEGNLLPGEYIILIDNPRRLLLRFWIRKRVLAGSGSMGTWGRKYLAIFLKFLSMLIEIL